MKSSVLRNIGSRQMVTRTLSACAIALLFQIAPQTSLAAGSLDQPIELDIPERSSLEDALIQWGLKAGVTVLINTHTVDQVLSKGVHGKLSARKALALLLQGSGLSYTENGDTISIVPASHLVRSSSNASVSGTYDVGAATATSDEEESHQYASPVSATRRDIDEVVVTAQKREQRLQDVPIPVTAVNATALVESGQVRLQDFYSQVPGLIVTPNDYGSMHLTIRGMDTGEYNNPAVAILIDDAPAGPAVSSLVGSNAVPDLDPSDMARVEVLRGPQGTLYGSASVGGLVKYVTVDPSPDKLAGRVEVGTSSVYNGAQLGYNGRAAVNVPLTDTLAVRMSGFTRRDPGYIDDPLRGIDGVNKTNAYGGRVSAMWRPSADFSIKLSGMLQRAEADGSSYVDLNTGLGNLQQTGLAGTGAFNRNDQFYSSTMKAKLGTADFVSVSGYSVNRLTDSYDYTTLFGKAVTTPLFGVPGTAIRNKINDSRFTQEFRLSDSVGKTLDWLVGTFYDHQNYPLVTSLLAENQNGAAVGTLLQALGESTQVEYAAFGDLTAHFTDRFDIQFGGRESRDTIITKSDPSYGALRGHSVVYSVRRHTTTDFFTYLVTPEFRITPDIMTYARFASGYRPGGSSGALFANLPQTYRPDSAQTYELGLKGDVLDNALSIDTAVYYIRWNNIQYTTKAQNVSYFTNGSGAKSQGVELSVQSRPVSGLTASAWVTWDEAVLTAPLVNSPSYGVSGDRLPYGSRFSGNASLQDEFQVGEETSAFFGASASYVGNREGEFAATPPPGTAPLRQTLPGYARIDVHSGLHYRSWTVNLFVNNAADRRGVISGGIGTLDKNAFYYIQPRTVGLNVSTTF